MSSNTDRTTFRGVLNWLEEEMKPFVMPIVKWGGKLMGFGLFMLFMCLASMLMYSWLFVYVKNFHIHNPNKTVYTVVFFNLKDY